MGTRHCATDVRAAEERGSMPTGDHSPVHPSKRRAFMGGARHIACLSWGPVTLPGLSCRRPGSASATARPVCVRTGRSGAECAVPWLLRLPRGQRIVVEPCNTASVRSRMDFLRPGRAFAVDPAGEVVDRTGHLGLRLDPLGARRRHLSTVPSLRSVACVAPRRSIGNFVETPCVHHAEHPDCSFARPAMTTTSSPPARRPPLHDGGA